MKTSLELNISVDLLFTLRFIWVIFFVGIDIYINKLRLYRVLSFEVFYILFLPEIEKT